MKKTIIAILSTLLLFALLTIGVSIPKVKIGQVWTFNPSDPFSEKFDIKILDKRDGYVKVLYDGRFVYSMPVSWVRHCFKLKDQMKEEEK